MLAKPFAVPQTLQTKTYYDQSNILDAEMDRLFVKSDFKNLKVCGQFNKGFIIAQLQDSDDLFILDQHASDEKFNFETLSRTTQVQGQDLVVPLKIELGVTEALAVEQHRDIFEFNGFRVTKSGDDWVLKSLPISKNTVFTERDFYELVEKVKDNLDTATHGKEQGMIHKQQFRPRKVYHMLASRACRKSIMIGDALDHKQMCTVIQNLTTLQSPWNCPHGRPTMRHLGTVSTTTSH